MRGKLVTVDEHTFEPKPTIKENIYSDSSFSTIYPLSGPSLENHRKFSGKYPFKYQEEAAKIKKGENVLFTVGLGGGKTTTAKILAFECALRGRTNFTDNLLSLPVGHSIMVLSSASLTQDLYEKARELSIELFSGEVVVQQYTRTMSNDERRTVRESFQSIDLLIITWDYYYRTLTKWSHHQDKENCNEDWTNFLLKPAMVFMDEIDFMDNYTVASASKMAVTWQIVNPEGVLVSLSGTISNGEEFGKKFFRSDKIKVIEGSERRGKIKVQVVSNAFHEKVGSEKEGDLRHKAFLISLTKLKVALEYLDIKAIENRKPSEEWHKGLVFVDHKVFIGHLNTYYNLGHRIGTLHGDLSPQENSEVIKKFRSGEYLGLLTTKKLEVGIDIGEVNSGILYGLPRYRRGYLQRLRRFGRNPGSESFIRIILREENPLERLLIENKEERQRFLFSEQPETFSFSPDNSRSLEFGIFFGVAAGLKRLQDFQKLVKGFEHAEEKLQRVLTKLYGLGCIYMVKDKITATRLTSEKIFEFNFRSMEPRYKVQISGSNKEVGSIGVKRLLRNGCVGEVMALSGESHKVKEINYKDKILTVEPGYSPYDVWNYIQREVVPRNILCVDPELGISLGEIDVSMSVSKIRLVDRETGKTYIEIKPFPESQLKEVTYGTYGISFELKSQNNGIELSRNCIQIFGTAILATLRGKLEFDPRGMSIGVEKNPSRTHSALYLIDDSGPSGYADRVYEKAREILGETLTNMENCSCRMRGCWSCLSIQDLPGGITSLRQVEVQKVVEALKGLDGGFN